MDKRVDSLTINKIDKFLTKLTKQDKEESN